MKLERAWEGEGEVLTKNVLFHTGRQDTNKHQGFPFKVLKILMMAHASVLGSVAYNMPHGTSWFQKFLSFLSFPSSILRLFLDASD